MEGAAETFLSEEHTIRVEVFRPDQDIRPAILLLHGANGLESGHAAHRKLANFLAQSGYITFFVHYFDRTGTKWADQETVRDLFLTWRKTIIDAVTFASEDPNVLSQHIGIMGLSLGATLGLTVAGRLSKIRAMAEFSGEMPGPALGLMKTMPPTLIVHGGMDPIIPVGQAYKLQEWLRERDIPVELAIYPEQGHVLREPVAQQAVMRTVAFFDRYLRPASEQ